MRVTLGDKPHNVIPGEKGNRIYVFNSTPRDESGRPMEPDQRGSVYSRPEIRAWGPGFNGDEVVRSSREAYSWEKPCPNDNKRCYKNFYLPRMTIGPDGSPAGHYRICVAPQGKSVPNADHGVCREYDLKDNR